MKRLIILIMIVVGMTAQGQNTLSLSSASGHPGDEVTVTLSLANSDAVTALQTFIPLGSQLSYVPGSAALTTRSNGHQLSATVMRDTLRLYSYSLALNSYNGTSGALLTFRVRLGREPGSYSLMPSQTVLSSETGAALGTQTSSSAITILSPKVQVTPATIDYGHVPIRSSYTRNVTVRNIGNEPLTLAAVSLSDGSLGTQASLPATIAASGQQNITLTYSPTVAGATTYRAVFHTNAQVGDSIVTIAADPYSVNELRPLSVSGYTDSTVTVELRMNNMDSIVGLQTSIRLPEALTYVPGSFTPDATRAAGYLATAGVQGDTLTLLMTSMTDTPIHGADGVVARFQLRLHGYSSHTLQLLNTSLSNEHGRNVLSAVYTGTVSIYSPSLSCNSSLGFGNTPVTETATAELQISNYGNAPLVIDHVAFTQDGWRMTTSLPVTVQNYGNTTLQLSYTGTTEGNNRAQLLLYTNDPRNDLKRINLTSQRYEPNSLYMKGNAEAQAATPEVDIMLDNYSAVTALQMDVQYPHNDFSLEPSDISVSSRGNGHIVSAARQNDSTLRVLVLSMQNQPFSGHSGSVARLQLHAHDSLSTDSYPITLSNVTSGCVDGIDRLTSIQSTEWFAIRVRLDTTYIEVHDTTYIPDTNLTPVIVYDTTLRDTLVYHIIPQDSIVYTFIPQDSIVYTLIPRDSVVYTLIPKDSIVYTLIPRDSITYTLIPRDSIVYTLIPKDSIVYTLIPQDSIVYDFTYRDTTVYNITNVDTTIYLPTYVDTTIYHVAQVDTTVYNITNIDTTIYLPTYVDTTIYNIAQVDTTVYNITNVDTTIYVLTYIDTTIHVPLYVDSVVYNISNVDTTIYNVTNVDTTVYNITHVDTTVFVPTYVDTTIYNVTNVDTTIYVPTYIDTTIHVPVYLDSVVYNISNVDTTVYNITNVDTTVYNITHVDTTVFVPTYVDTTIYNVTDVDTTIYVPTYIDTTIHVPVYLDSVVYNVTNVDTTVYNFTVVDTVVVDSTLVPVVDTLWLHDTQWLHDTIHYTIFIHDTTVNTIFVHDTIVIHDTIVVGIDDIETIDAKIYSSNRHIVVEGAGSNTVRLYDINGRILATKQDDYAPLRFDVHASGTYMIKIGNHPARKVVVIR